MRLLLVLTLVLTRPLVAQDSTAADLASARRGIEAGNAQYRAAFLAMDADRLAAVYDSQGARLGDKGEVVRGRAAIAGDVAAFVSRTGPVTVTIETAQVWLIDDTAYETGAWSYTYHPQGQGTQRIGGRYVTLWRHQPDGGWKIWADMGVPGT
jgi:uncharacterized protein (TIGR02246 family)